MRYVDPNTVDLSVVKPTCVQCGGFEVCQSCHMNEWIERHQCMNCDKLVYDGNGHMTAVGPFCGPEGASECEYLYWETVAAIKARNQGRG